MSTPWLMMLFVNLPLAKNIFRILKEGQVISSLFFENKVIFKCLLKACEKSVVHYLR